MSKPFFIFDFDGTIADTFNALLRVSDLLAEEFHFRKIDPSEVETFRNKTSFQILTSLKIPLFKLPKILKRARLELAKQMLSINSFPGMNETLQQLKPLSQHMGIITTNSIQNVKGFLENQALDLFDFIKTTSRISQKYEELRKIKKNLSSNQMLVYIGDEIRDIEAARRASAISIAVTWGYNTPQVLKTYQPDYLVNSPQELLRVCQQLSFPLRSEAILSEKNK